MEAESIEEKQNGKIAGEERKGTNDNSRDSETKKENEHTETAEEQKQVTANGQNDTVAEDEQHSATTDEQHSATTDERQQATANGQHLETSGENRTATEDEQHSDEQQPATADEQQPATADEQQPATADEQQPATADEQQPATADEQQSEAANEQHPATADEQQQQSELADKNHSPTTDEQQPTATDEQQQATANGQKLETSGDSRTVTEDEQHSDEQQPATADEQQPESSAESQPKSADEQQSDAANEQHPATADEQQQSELADKNHSPTTDDQQPTATDGQLETADEEQQQPTPDEVQLEVSAETRSFTIDGETGQVSSAPTVILEEKPPVVSTHEPLDDSTGEYDVREDNIHEGNNEEQNVMANGIKWDEDSEAIQIERSLASLVEGSSEEFDSNESSTKSISMNDEIENIRRNEDDYAVVTAADNGNDIDRDKGEKIEEEEETEKRDRVDEVHVNGDAILSENDAENQTKALGVSKVSADSDDGSSGVEKERNSTVKSETVEAAEKIAGNDGEGKGESFGNEVRLVGRFEASSNRQEVIAMAILDDELFVICKQPCIVIFKYDIGDETAPDGRAEPVELALSELIQPRGLAASPTNNYLYITDRHSYNGGRVWRYRYARGRERRREAPAVEIDMEPHGISVSYNDLVLVTCSHTSFQSSGKVVIFKEYDHGLLVVRTLVIDAFENPRHAVLLPRQRPSKEEESKDAGSQLNDEFLVVCHGWNIWDSHGVSLSRVGQRGGVRLRYGRRGDGPLEVDQPASLAVDADGDVYAVDCGNHRVSLLSRDLILKRHLVTATQHACVCHPRHLCIHSTAGSGSRRRMFVGQKDGSVLVFSHD